MFGKVDSILLFVSDLAKSREFYTNLNFQIEDYSSKSFTAKTGDFSLQCFDKTQVIYAQDTSKEPKGAGVFIYFRVENVDSFYEYLLTKHLTPSDSPKYQPWGNREFVIKDPDGYKIVVYAKT